MTDEELDILQTYRRKLFSFYYTFCNNIDEILESNLELDQEKCVLFNQCFLKDLEELADNNSKLEILDSDAKDNIYKILLFLRQNDHISDEKTRISNINRYNEIIGKLNCARETYSEDFAKEEVLFRVNKPEKVERRIVNSYRSLLNEMYGYDIKILDVLFSEEEEFYENSKDFALNEYYFLTINSFIRNIPFVFKEDDIYIRTLAILKVNKNYKQLYFRNNAFMQKNHYTDRNVKILKKKLDNI